MTASTSTENAAAGTCTIRTENGSLEYSHYQLFKVERFAEGRSFKYYFSSKEDAEKAKRVMEEHCNKEGSDLEIEIEEDWYERDSKRGQCFRLIPQDDDKIKFTAADAEKAEELHAELSAGQQQVLKLEKEAAVLKRQGFW